jgi:hypothetical protein
MTLTQAGQHVVHGHRAHHSRLPPIHRSLGNPRDQQGENATTLFFLRQSNFIKIS